MTGYIVYRLKAVTLIFQNCIVLPVTPQWEKYMAIAIALVAVILGIFFFGTIISDHSNGPLWALTHSRNSARVLYNTTAHVVEVPGAMDGYHSHNIQHKSTIHPSFAAMVNLHCCTNGVAPTPTHQGTTENAHTNPDLPTLRNSPTLLVKTWIIWLVSHSQPQQRIFIQLYFNA